jgi:hypothetical protein
VAKAQPEIPEMLMRRKDIFADNVDGILFLVDEHVGRIHSLNSTAALIWQLLEEQVAHADLEEDMMAVFPQIAPRQIKADLRLVLKNFREMGILDDNKKD